MQHIENKFLKRKEEKNNKQRNPERVESFCSLLGYGLKEEAVRCGGLG
jgi:hypothetical protein